MIRRTNDRGISPVIAGILVVGIVVVLAVGAGAMFLSFGEEATGQQPLRSAVTIYESEAGSTLEVKSISQKLVVKMNGQPVKTLNQSDIGEHFLPTAPGDRVTVVVPGEQGSIVAQKNIDEENAGNYILYYDFSNGTGSKVIDRSGNTNTGQIGGDPQWVEDAAGTALKFDGQDDYVETLTLNAKAVTDVKEFTVAIEYNTTGQGANVGDVQQLIEHRYTTGSSGEWFLETNDEPAPHKLDYEVEFPSGGQIKSGGLGENENHIVVATFDGETMEMYVDGKLVGNDTIETTVEMGQLSIAADGNNENIQYLDGKIYELRLYYTAMDEASAEILTEVMDD